MLALRALFAFLLLPGLMAGVFPALIARIPSARFTPIPFGWIPLIPGFAILVAAVVSFYRRGKGTLAPWDPPTRLVVQDLYRFNRNPMYVGIMLMLLGWSAWAGSFWILAYAAGLFLAFHLRIVLYEEHEMQRLFPGDWPEYRNHVPRWGWRWRPYDPGNDCARSLGHSRFMARPVRLRMGRSGASARHSPHAGRKGKHIMDDLQLTPVETHIYRASGNLDVTRRRRRMVFISGSLFAGILLVGTLIVQRWEVPLAVGLLYIGMTVVEKIAYANAILNYKSVIQKLDRRITDLQLPASSDRTD